MSIGNIKRDKGGDIMKRIPEDIEEDFVTDVDGYVYFWPIGNGHHSSAQLRQIADELDKRNAVWDETVKKELTKEK